MSNHDTKLSLHQLHIILVILLALLTFQGWLGDTINLFAVFPSGAVNHSVTGLIQAILAVGPMFVGSVLIIHVLNAFLVLSLGIVVAAMTFKSTKSRGARIASILGLIFIASAIAGGVLFILSGFLDDPYSAQMGGSFIFAYASYFIVLYYTKQ